MQNHHTKNSIKERVIKLKQLKDGWITYLRYFKFIASNQKENMLKNQRTLMIPIKKILINFLYRNALLLNPVLIKGLKFIP